MYKFKIRYRDKSFKYNYRLYCDGVKIKRNTRVTINSNSRFHIEECNVLSSKAWFFYVILFTILNFFGYASRDEFFEDFSNTIKRIQFEIVPDINCKDIIININNMGNIQDVKNVTSYSIIENKDTSDSVLKQRFEKIRTMIKKIKITIVLVLLAFVASVIIIALLIGEK